MTNKTRLLSRMYFFVAGNLSPIQQGIQAGHAALEYARTYYHTDLLRDFMKYDKTWIILNGGTTRSDYNDMGTLNQILWDLRKNEILCADFREPDLNHALTAVCFICDERVYNKEKYPDFNLDTEVVQRDTYSFWVDWVGGYRNVFLRELLNGKRLA